jgi:Escherichia/Staphylococcus phage prohead protease
MSEIEIRAAWPMQLRAMDERIVEGIAVPWNETSYVAGDAAGERFLPGSVTRSIRSRGDRLKLFRNHDHTTAIGRTVKLDPRHEAGLWGSWQIANTPAGDAALQEIAEGMLDAFSVGFRPLKVRRGQDGAREVVDAELHEVSLAPLGAYDGARVLAMRSPSYGADDVTAWLEAHPAPVVDLAPLPDLGRYSRR